MERVYWGRSPSSIKRLFTSIETVIFAFLLINAVLIVHRSCNFRGIDMHIICQNAAIKWMIHDVCVCVWFFLQVERLFDWMHPMPLLYHPTKIYRRQVSKCRLNQSFHCVFGAVKRHKVNQKNYQTALPFLL